MAALRAQGVVNGNERLEFWGGLADMHFERVFLMHDVLVSAKARASSAGSGLSSGLVKVRPEQTGMRPLADELAALDLMCISKNQ
jgi:hypothetical protein